MTEEFAINRRTQVAGAAVFIGAAIGAALLMQHGFAQQPAESIDARWVSPRQSPKCLIETDVFDGLNANMDRSTALVLEKIGAPHVVYLSGGTEKWIYFVAPNKGQPYVVELLIRNG